MRQRFLGHFKETDETVTKLWKTATFVFDANVLLNLYRYSEDTRNDFLSLLLKLQSRSWLPERAAHEFLKNRTKVIIDQITSYKTALRDIEKLRSSFSGSRAHPFISNDTKKKFDSAVEQIMAEMEKNREKQETLINNDGIKDQVADIFDGRVGEGYTSDELDQIFTQGAQRYADKVPPGYKDGGKFPDAKTETDKMSNYGDWIIWKQIMDYAASQKRPIIFVTDDRKEDWWEEEYGKTVGPRPELKKEFAETSGQFILIYKPEIFLNTSEDKLNIEIRKNSIKEVKAEHLERLDNNQKRYFSRIYDQRENIGNINTENDLFNDKKINSESNLLSKDYSKNMLNRLGRKYMGIFEKNEYPEIKMEILEEIKQANIRRRFLMNRANMIEIELANAIEYEETELVNNLKTQRKLIIDELNDLSKSIFDLQEIIAPFNQSDDF